MLRNALLWLSEQQQVFNFVKGNGLARRFASRFVAGETLEDAVVAVKGANRESLTATLDLLGESVESEEDATAARKEVEEVLDRISSEQLDGNVSIKLTQMGLDIDENFCGDNVSKLLAHARKLGIFVRVDMESSEHVERTLDLFQNRFYPEFGNFVGAVIQSMLYRSSDDTEMLVDLGARVRLVKGAYAEPESVAYPKKEDVDAQYARLTEVLLARGNYPAIATHDEALIDHTIEYAQKNGISNDRFEFQMLYGVRRDLQADLRKKGYNVRVYVPYGTQWYPYLMRRLAERPANLAMIVGNVAKESLPWK